MFFTLENSLEKPVLVLAIERTCGGVWYLAMLSCLAVQNCCILLRSRLFFCLCIRSWYALLFIFLSVLFFCICLCQRSAFLTSFCLIPFNRIYFEKKRQKLQVKNYFSQFFLKKTKILLKSTKILQKIFRLKNFSRFARKVF